MNKKLDRFKQWAGERMGGEVKTNSSDDFKALEAEMQLRFEGMERMQKSMTLYIKSLSKRSETEDKEKLLPVGYLGSTMIKHGEEFESDSEFGNCLIGLGRANERLARMQETYVADATTSWLESLERSLAQMKDYQAARKKLETRRLAYDTSLIKMQKTKKEDFHMEEELRSQKAKYEESTEDVLRRMQDIKETEIDSVVDLTSFLEAELTYHDRCTEVLMQLMRDWPAATSSTGDARETRRDPRSRSNTTGSFSRRAEQIDEGPLPDPRPALSRMMSRGNSPRKHSPSSEVAPSLPARPLYSRSNTESGARQHRDFSPVPPRLSRVPTEPSVILANRAQLKPVKRGAVNSNIFGDPSDYSLVQDSSSPDRYYDEVSASPATSYDSGYSRSASWSAVDAGGSNGMKKAAPPPPPPSRAKKPPPPPPPMKRSAPSSSGIPRA